MPGIDRFNKRWASTGQVDDTITDNNANLGLAFLGEEPPTIELHNKMFQWLDDKDNLLFNWLNETVKERTGGAGLTAETSTLLRDAIATAASYTKTGLQRNGTIAEVGAMLLENVTITPATLKPIIDALQLGTARAVPSGAVMPFAMPTPPFGWTVCDGQSYLRTDKPLLFAAIGVTYGSANGNSFNVPDIRHKTVRGWPNQATGPDANRALGSTQQPTNQAHTHTLTMAAIPAHSHTYTTAAVADHTHGVTINAAGTHTHTGSTAADGVHNHSAWTDAQGYHGHTGVTYAAGNHAHQLPRAANSDVGNGAPNVTTANGGAGWTAVSTYSGDHQHSLAIDANGNHGHNIGMAVSVAHTHVVTIAAVADHTHGNSMSGAGGHTHTGSTDATTPTAPTGTLASEGGENRVLNISLLYCIKD